MIYFKGANENMKLNFYDWCMSNNRQDLFKKEYAIFNGYEYLEIPYYYIIDNSYKDLIINKINEIQYI